MNRRSAVAGAHTLLVIVLLLTWPSWWTPPRFDHDTVITATPIRWLMIATPFLWGWAAHYSEGKRRRAGLIGSALLFVVCLMFIWLHDARDPCLWASPECSDWWRRWFR